MINKVAHCILLQVIIFSTVYRLLSVLARPRHFAKIFLTLILQKRRLRFNNISNIESINKSINKSIINNDDCTGVTENHSHFVQQLTFSSPLSH